MQVEYRCKGCVVSDDSKALIEDRVHRLSKYLGEVDRAEVFFERSQNPAQSDKVHAEITLRLASTVARAKGAAEDELAAFDRAEHKLAHQLEKLKGRLLARSHPHHRTDKVADLSQLDEVPQIVRSKAFELEVLDPETAAVRMELLSHSFYLFINSLTERSAVVYRRGDGSVGLIDQAEVADPS
ncbi:MAG: ribosome hibernation-promoting factor, HPF/YfiA family [Ferrimicrobium sp.]|uniref:ribosome hibernation-promoting factor, HPF/YfiA family n=1 Tax=Ferrimicrobium sp. TaxID=2926050 RepID=UPI00262F6A50|nr:ribosome-associated translation inhibitor RaiA [Ferrimicrobium sp.]